MKFSDLSYTDPEDFKNLMIVDGLNLAFRFKHANTKNFALQYIKVIKSLAASYEAGKIIVLGDGKSKYRKNLYPEYKANRDIIKNKQTTEEEKDFKDFIEEFTKALQILNNHYLTMRFSTIEADDIAAYIVRNYYKHFDHIWLISSDKDWDLMIKDNVSRFSYVTRKEITKDNWNTHYSYDLENHIDIKVLQGDKGDNIKGCEGIGEKRAYALIREYGTALDIYDALPLPGKQKFIANLNNFGDNILLNIELMDLMLYCQDALGENVIKIDKKLEEYING